MKFMGLVSALFLVLASEGYVGAFGGQGGLLLGHALHGEHLPQRFPHKGPFPHQGGPFHPFGGHAFSRDHFAHGWAGPFFPSLAFRRSQPVVFIKKPFFCLPHGLGFAAWDAFLTHLQTDHNLFAEHTTAHLVRTGGRLLFLGF